MLSFCYHTAKKKDTVSAAIEGGPHQEKEIRNCLTFHLLENDLVKPALDRFWNPNAPNF